jgi:hypothetical protein
MSNKDFFADIAFTHHPIGKDEMAEINPIDYEKRYFVPSNVASERVNEKTYGEQLDEFRKELKALRNKYEPFMSCNVPKAEIERKSLELKEFKFRYKTEEDKKFSSIIEGRGSWEEVTLPDYRGPAGEKGKWTGYYRREFSFHKNEGKTVYIVCKAVDYIANVYLNGRFIGSHEGFFAPFEFDITEVIEENNILVVEVKNDFTILGVEGDILDGDKIYAATGPGWDDPQTGWHHCPPGAGIYNKVFIEERSPLFIDDIFVRPDIDNNSIEVRVGVTSSYHRIFRDFEIQLDLYSRNFIDAEKRTINYKVPYIGPGKNEYRYKIDFANYRLWEPETPWLYTMRGSILKNDEVLDIRDRNFGMRKFHMDESTEPKGTLYFNNKPIILRGANEMGHLQQCIMKNDMEQLVEDILIGKLANMNYYRITQRPVQEELYDYFDMLGMMHQCDFPLFGFLRRNQFSEAVRQVGEMERLIRSHPSSIMVTFINEPMMIRVDKNLEEKYIRRYYEKGHRHLFRDELEAFFEAGRKAIYVENPDRVVKNVEGDYDPPTSNGLSDFHCYNMWYTNHALPIGKLYKGYIPAIKKGWKTGCGEYGTEGLDNYEVMMKYYPKEWIPENNEEHWLPSKIVRAQTNNLHGDWYEEQTNILDWIKESQKHQAFSTKLMNDALRRRSDIINHTAVHLLIDAWPSGWMKTLVDVDRVPKPAYFSFKDTLKPVRVNLRCDRWKAYSGEEIEVETWFLNDSNYEYKNASIVVTLRDEERDHESYRINCDSKEVTSSYAGTIKFRVPEVVGRKTLFVDAALIDSEGDIINNERFKIEAFEKAKGVINQKVAYLGGQAKEILERLNINSNSFDKHESGFDVGIISDINSFYENQKSIVEKVKSGARLVFIRDDENGLQGEIEGIKFNTKKLNGVFFAAINKEDKRMKEFRSGDFSYWYNSEQDIIDFTADSFIDCEKAEPLIYTYGKSGFYNPEKGMKKRLPVVGSVKLGKGEIILCCIPLKGKIGYNPVLDRFLANLI